MAIPISASFGPDAVSEVIALTGGNPQRMAQLGASRPEFKPALAVLHLIKQQAGAPQMPTQSIAQQAMNPPPPQNPGATGLGAVNVPKGPPMGQMPGQPPMQMAAAGPSGSQTTPPPQPMQQMAGGGLLALDNSAFDEQSFSGGGIVAFAGGGDSKAERRKALMRIIRTAETSDQRMAARMELNAMDGMDPGRTPGRGLADALAYTQDDLPQRQPVSSDASIYSPDSGEPRGTRLDPAEFNRNPPPSNLFGNAEAAQRGPRIAESLASLDASMGASGGTRMDPAGYKPPPANLFRNAEAAQRGPNLSGFGDALAAANLRETDAARGTDASGGMSLRSPELAAIDARSRAKNEAAGQVPFRGFGDALRSPELAAIDARSRAKNEAAGQVPFKGAGKYFLPIPERLAFEARERSKAAESPAGNRGAGSEPPFSLDSYQPKQYGFNDAMRQKVEGGLGVIAPRAERGAPPSGSRTAPPPPTRKSDTPFIDTALRTSRTPPGVKDNPDQTDETLDSILAKRKGYMGPDVNYKGTSAEDKDARRQEDLWSMLAQIGFNTMAGTSQFGLENVGKGAAAAMPAMQEAMKNRRADDREDRKLEFESLLSQRKERGEGFDSSMREFGRLDDKKQALTIAQMNDKTNRAQIAAGERNAALSAVTDQDKIIKLMSSSNPEDRILGQKMLDSKKYYDPNRDERSDEALIGQKRTRIEGEIKNVQGDRSKPIAQRNAEVAALRQQLSDLSKPGANNVDPLVAKYLK